MSLYDFVVCFYTNKLYPYEWVVGYVKLFCFHCTTYLTPLPLEQIDLWHEKKSSPSCSIRSLTRPSLYHISECLFCRLSHTFVCYKSWAAQKQCNVDTACLGNAVTQGMIYSLEKVHFLLMAKVFRRIQAACVKTEVPYSKRIWPISVADEGELIMWELKLWVRFC